jgi:hypothetical protein
LTYSRVIGTLPPGLTIQPSGDITGIPTSAGVYTATMVASTGSIYDASNWAAVTSLQQYTAAVSLPQPFTITVKNFSDTYTNIYVKPFLPLAQRKIYNDFISSSSIFVPELIYRPDDSNFGVQKDLKMYVSYGVEELTSATNYASIVSNIHPAELYFDGVSTITAYDSSNKPIYDMVYVQILDSGTGLLAKLKLQTSLRTNIDFVPLWQQTAQNNNDYLYAVVLCYALPGEGQKIVDRFERLSRLGGFKFNTINFTVDRLIFDHTKSNTSSSYLIF